MRPVLINKSEIALSDSLWVDIAVTRGKKTPDIAVEKAMYIDCMLMPTENTAIATVPTQAPNINCPVLQYIRSIIMLRNIKNEYSATSLRNPHSNFLKWILIFIFFLQYKKKKKKLRKLKTDVATTSPMAR